MFYTTHSYVLGGFGRDTKEKTSREEVTADVKNSLSPIGYSRMVSKSGTHIC